MAYNYWLRNTKIITMKEIEEVFDAGAKASYEQINGKIGAEGFAKARAEAVKRYNEDMIEFAAKQFNVPPVGHKPDSVPKDWEYGTTKTEYRWSDPEFDRKTWQNPVWWVKGVIVIASIMLGLVVCFYIFN